MTRIVVLISGSGTNLQSLIDACESEYLNAKIVAVFSNKADAYGLERATNAAIDSQYLSMKDYAGRTEFDSALMDKIDAYQPDLVVLAGYMRILSDEFVDHYLGKMLNIHPSLLPKYPGLHTHQRAIEAKDTEHGASIHFVTPELDGGPVILQAKVPVFEDDSVESLAARVQTQEHKIYPLVCKWFVEGRLEMKDGKAILDSVVLGKFGYADC